MERKYILEVIHKYIKDYKMYRTPTYRQRREFFAQESYGRWTVKEALRIALYSPEPLLELKRFTKRMGDYACRTKTETQKFMYAIAYDVLTDILCELI